MVVAVCILCVFCVVLIFTCFVHMYVGIVQTKSWRLAGGKLEIGWSLC